ncbi:MAG TPA: VTT domain-containing protein [archaeon]|nr:VTT domain-containing protein [archaeon]
MSTDILVAISQKLLEYGNYLVAHFGYFGIMAIGFIGTATIILPTFPLSALVFLMGSVLNPVLLGLSAGFGSATGELVGYAVGHGGKKTLLKKYEKQLKKMHSIFHKYRGGVVIFALAAIPIVPFDVVGLFCGIVGYNWKKFYTFLFLGKTLRYTFIAFAGFYGLQLITTYFD